jgi:hypothetical protein
MRLIPLFIACFAVTAASWLQQPAHAAPPAPDDGGTTTAASAAPIDAVSAILFQDSTARASASVAQVLPGSKEPPQLFTHVSKVELHGPVLVIHWAGSAITILPLQFVATLTINQQAAAPATTRPAPAAASQP